MWITLWKSVPMILGDGVPGKASPKIMGTPGDARQVGGKSAGQTPYSASPKIMGTFGDGRTGRASPPLRSIERGRGDAEKPTPENRWSA